MSGLDVDCKRCPTLTTHFILSNRLVGADAVKEPARLGRDIGQVQRRGQPRDGRVHVRARAHDRVRAHAHDRVRVHDRDHVPRRFEQLLNEIYTSRSSSALAPIVFRSRDRAKPPLVEGAFPFRVSRSWRYRDIALAVEP